MSNVRTYAKLLRQLGRHGDTDLVHVNEWEKHVLKMMGGAGTTNPETGLKEYNIGADYSASVNAGMDRSTLERDTRDATGFGGSGSDRDRDIMNWGTNQSYTPGSYGNLSTSSTPTNAYSDYLNTLFGGFFNTSKNTTTPTKPTVSTWTNPDTADVVGIGADNKITDVTSAAGSDITNDYVTGQRGDSATSYGGALTQTGNFNIVSDPTGARTFIPTNADYNIGTAAKNAAFGQVPGLGGTMSSPYMTTGDPVLDATISHLVSQIPLGSAALLGTDLAYASGMTGVVDAPQPRRTEGNQREEELLGQVANGFGSALGGAGANPPASGGGAGPTPPGGGSTGTPQTPTSGGQTSNQNPTQSPNLGQGGNVTNPQTGTTNPGLYNPFAGLTPEQIAMIQAQLQSAAYKTVAVRHPVTGQIMYLPASPTPGTEFNFADPYASPPPPVIRV